MGNSYILEAFKEFDLLEDTDSKFPLDRDGMEDLSSFLDIGEEDDDTSVDVIDLEAEAEDELKQSYVGKVILDCNVCHSNIFVDKDEITIEDDGTACLDVECPYCMSDEGFSIIGEVRPYGEEEEEPEEEIPEEEESEVEEEPVEDDEELEEGIKEVAIGAAVDKAIDKVADGFENVKDQIADRFEEALQYVSLQDLIGWVSEHEQAARDIEDHYGKELDDMNTDEILDFIYDHDQLASDFEAHFQMNESFDSSLAFDVLQWACSDEGLKEGIERRCGKPVHMLESAEILKCVKGSRKLSESFEKHFGKTLNESVIDVDTQSGSTNIETEEELITVDKNEEGGITINTQPLDDVEVGAEPDAEVIAPLDLEGEAEILDGADERSYDDNFDEAEDDLEDFNFEDEFPMDDFDEESFDELGESYLRKCYENVNSFKTIDVAFDGKDMIVEGVIGFDSGNKKKTTFKFTISEAKNDKVYFTGLNEQISKGEKSFNLRGKVVDRKLTCESFRYNYKTKNELNESVKVYGTVRRELTEAKKEYPIRDELAAAGVLKEMDKDPKGAIKKALEVIMSSDKVSDKDKAAFQKAMKGPFNKALSALATYAYDVPKATL